MPAQNQQGQTNYNLQSHDYCGMCYLCLIFFILRKFSYEVEIESNFDISFTTMSVTNRLIFKIHILQNVSSAVTCFWNKTEFSSEVIYKHPKYNQAYDIAILKVPDNIPNEYFAEHDTDPVNVGDTVYSIGFPYFSTLSTKIDSPSIYEGRITKISKGMILSDVNVQAGKINS